MARGGEGGAVSRRAVWILPVLALAAVSRAQEPADDERVDDPRGSPAVREALAERLITCLDAEGSPPSPADREVIRDVSAALASTVTRARCEDLSDGPGDACAARIRSGSCESLVASLGPAGLAPTSAPWAEALARALAARVLTCATAERDGGPLAPEDREALTADAIAEVGWRARARGCSRPRGAARAAAGSPPRAGRRRACARPSWWRW
jgi:hypothetical protein